MSRQNRITPLQELTLLDRFLFDETMEDLEACRAMLEIVLESEKVIALQSAESEKEMRTSPDLRAVRLDVFAKDGAVRIFLNTRGKDPEGVGQELIDFLQYIEHPDEDHVKMSMSPRLKTVHQQVLRVKASEEVGVKYMQEWEEKIYIREEGKEEGKKEGIQEGIAALILDNLEEGKTGEEIIRKLIRRFSLTEEEAEKAFEKYESRI